MRRPRLFVWQVSSPQGTVPLTAGNFSLVPLESGHLIEGSLRPALHYQAHMLFLTSGLRAPRSWKKLGNHTLYGVCYP